MKSSAMLATAAVITLVATGCTSTTTGSGTRAVAISATEMAYTPATIAAKPGERIRFVVSNTGKVEHEFESPQLGFAELEIAPGKSDSVVVTMPDQPGEYAFFCDSPGHKEAGMTGKIIVAP